MSKHLRSARPSTLIVAVLALVLALGGTATAAKLITGKQIKNSSLTGADVKGSSLTGSDVKNGSIGPADLSNAAKAAKGAKGDTGAAGAAGAAGAPGAKGDAGAKGDTGAAGADTGTALMGKISNLPNDASTVFGYPLGQSSANSTQALREFIAPNVATKARDFAVRLTDAPGAGGSRLFFVKINNAVAMPCNIPVGPSSGCESDLTVNVPARARITIQQTGGGTPDTTDALFSLRLTTP